jgi:hypothetical protein
MMTTGTTETSTAIPSTAVSKLGDIVLDPHDPFEAVLIKVILMFRAKNKDYADGESWSSNFEDVAKQENMDHPVRAADAFIAVKQARLRALGKKKTDPANESVYDTYLDRAVYSVIALALIGDERFRAC